MGERVWWNPSGKKHDGMADLTMSETKTTFIYQEAGIQ